MKLYDHYCKLLVFWGAFLSVFFWGFNNFQALNTSTKSSYSLLEIHRDIATEKGLPEKVVENLVKADQIEDEMYLSFINDCLIKGKAGLFDTVKKVNLDIEDNEKDSESSLSHERS